MYNFGSGNLIALVGTIPVARKFGALQEVQVDFSFTLKELYGQSQFPLAVARGQGKITGTAKAALINGGLLNDFFFQGTNATGTVQQIIDEAGSIPATPGPYTVTVANSANFKEDMGVTYTATGLPLVRVASGPAAGQYTVAAGVYTFAAADQALAVKISYTFTVAASGNTTTITNQLMGTATTFAIDFPMTYNGKKAMLRLNACTSGKLTLATKIEDFLVPDFGFSAFADASGTIGSFYADE